MAKQTRTRPHTQRGRLSALTASLCATLLAMFTVLALSACGGGNNRNISQADLGTVRVLNAMADSPTLNFALENSSIANLSFGQISGFSQTRDGRFDLDVRFTALDDTATLLVDDFRTRVRQQEQTTVVVAGTTTAPVTFEFAADNPAIATGTSEFHVLNTANGSDINFHLTEPDAALGSATATVANNTVSELLSADSGTRRVRLTSSDSTVIFDSGSFELSSGRRVIFHVQPYFGPGDGTVRVRIIENGRSTGFANEQLPVSLRIANSIGDIAAVDAAIENAGTTVETLDIPVNTFTSAQLFVAGGTDLRVNMQTDPGTRFYEDTVQLVAGETRTLLVVGSVANGSTTGRLILDPQRPVGTAAQINILQGASSIDRADIYLLSDAETTDSRAADVTNLALLANSTGQVLAGTYDVVVTQTGNNTILAGPESITLANRDIRTILLTDADGGGTPARIIFGEQP